MSEEVRQPARKLPNRTNAPPGGWRYRVPETNQVFTGVSEHDLIVKLQAHYRINGYPYPDDMPGRIEHYVCSAEPSYCRDASGKPGKWSSKLAHTFHVVLQGSATLGHWMLKGREFVAQELADRRSATCAICPFNEEPQGCTSCNANALRETVAKLVGSRRSRYHEQLKACKVCHCQLQVKVWLPQAILLAHMPAEQQEQLPEHCWLRTEQPSTNPA